MTFPGKTCEIIETSPSYLIGTQKTSKQKRLCWTVEALDDLKGNGNISRDSVGFTLGIYPATWNK